MKPKTSLMSAITAVVLTDLAIESQISDIGRLQISKLVIAIAHHLRSAHWWSAEQCEYPLPLSLAKKIQEWCFSE